MVYTSIGAHCRQKQRINVVNKLKLADYGRQVNLGSLEGVPKAGRRERRFQNYCGFRNGKQEIVWEGEIICPL